MTVRRKYLAGASNAWRVAVYLSPRNNYEEVFYGTEAEATDREAELRAQKAAGRLLPSVKRTESPTESGYKRLHKERIICGGRGYIVLWQNVSKSHWRERAKVSVSNLHRPDLVMALDDRDGLPTEAEKQAIIRELTSELVRSTGKDWVIPEGIIDWGEW
jgi:hypothetical protein